MCYKTKFGYLDTNCIYPEIMLLKKKTNQEQNIMINS